MRRKVDLVILILVLIAGGFAAKNAQAIGDWWHARQYQPPAEIVKLADDAGMNDEGKKLFYRFSPQLVDQQTLDSVCSVEKLGCTTGQSIYILQPSSNAEYNRDIVTAAHEMLHVAYSRLSTSEKDNLTPLLDAELAKPAASDIVAELKTYDDAAHDNEAHSFIGSQLAVVSPDLNAYYNRYFIDRSKSTDAYAASPEH